MRIADAITEARAIDGRAVSGLLPPIEDVLRAMELDQVFADLVDAEPTEERKCNLATLIVHRLSDAGRPQDR